MGYPPPPPVPFHETIYNIEQDSMRESARIYRDAFCREYIKDFNSKNAVIRLGAPDKASAATKGCNLLQEPYVANRNKQLIRQLKPDDVITRQEVMAKMWEEANSEQNAGKTRVAALAHVAKMLGMMIDKPTDAAAAPIGVMIVPVMDVEDWQASATRTQELLKRDAAPPVIACPAPQTFAHGRS